MKACLTILFICLSAQLAWSQYYYVNTYENLRASNSERFFSDIYVKSIDLNNRSVVDSLKLNNRGFIDFSIPASVIVDGQKYLIIISEGGGGPSKNSVFEDSQKVFYSIVRANGGKLSLVRCDSVIGAMADGFRQYQGEEGFRFGLRKYPDTTTLYDLGLYTLDKNLNFTYIGPEPAGGENPGYIDGIGVFDFLIKVPFDNNHHLYYGVRYSQYWLAKLNDDATAVIDSAQLRFSGGAATLFAFNPKQDRFYCLHVNYELHTGEIDSVYKRRQDYYVDPDVVIYDPNTLDILEKHSIADYPEGQYPTKENGLADVVGDFIVYYFFWGDEFYSYYPAMLFIFDTRTNEATWLRVGWR